MITEPLSMIPELLEAKPVALWVTGVQAEVGLTEG